MGKLKTRNSAKKRFKETAKGKVVHRKRGWGHLRSKKSKKVRHRKRNPKKLSNDMSDKVKEMMRQ